MSTKQLHYDFADRAWQVVVGCDNTIPCWKACWAKRTVARLAGSPNALTAAAHAGLVRVLSAKAQAAGAPGLAWTGAVRINEAHLNDPLKWRKPAIIATGFHGDWGLLSVPDKDQMFDVMERCRHHQFFPLTKHHLSEHVDYLSNRAPLSNVNIGVSVMEQDDAAETLRKARWISEAGWKVHCWHEPAIGPVDWRGWEFLTWLVVGGQSAGTDEFNTQWAYDAIRWGRASLVPIKIKQLGSHPVSCENCPIDCQCGFHHGFNDRRGSDPSEWPQGLRVREMPEAQGVREK